MGKNKDSKKRKRRRMTPEEHATRRQTPLIQNAFAKVFASADANTGASASATDADALPASASSWSTNRTNAAAATTANGNTAGFSNVPATSSTVTEAHAQMDVEDPSMSNLNSTVIRDEGFSIQAVGISNPSPVEPSIDEDDGVDFDDDEAEDDKERGRKRVRRKRTDFQWRYMVALQKRLRTELNQAGDQVGALSSRWLVEFLEMHFYIVPCYCAPHICKKLRMKDKDVGLPAYYCDVKVWLPENNLESRQCHLAPIASQMKMSSATATPTHTLPESTLVLQRKCTPLVLDISAHTARRKGKSNSIRTATPRK